MFFKPSRTRSIDRSIASNPKKTLPPKSPRNTLPSIVSYSLRPEKKISMLFSKKNFFFHPRPGFELTLKRSWFPPQRAPSALRCRRFPARARARRRRRRRCCCPPTPPSHRIGIGKKRGVSNLGIDKNPIGIKPLYEPQPFEPAIPFF